MSAHLQCVEGIWGEFIKALEDMGRVYKGHWRIWGEFIKGIGIWGEFIKGIGI